MSFGSLGVTQKARKSRKSCPLAFRGHTEITEITEMMCFGFWGHTEITEITEMTLNDITYEIRGAIYDVYKNLGPGLLESVYEEALVFELEQRGLKVTRQKTVPIIYKGTHLHTELRLDLLVEDQVIIELKSVEEMKKVFAKQLLTYLRLSNLQVGLLVNFNTDDILHAIQRVVN